MTDWRKTRTGSYPLGFRRGWTDWQKDLPSLIAWSRENRLGLIDLGGDADTAAPLLRDAGIKIGTADLGGLDDWKSLISPDASRRKQAVDKISRYVETCCRLGIQNFFIVLLPENPALERKENMGYAIESFSALEPVLRAGKGRLVIEGWPGPGALACTPEGYRLFFKGCASPVFGVNFDPSHLLRMFIDPVRFLDEFQSRVYHVHGKDTDIDSRAVYEFGVEQPPTEAKAPDFGGSYWRYTIPGQGQTSWTQILQKLSAAKYAGGISIELEDASFNGTTEGEKHGILAGISFLENC